MASTFENDLRLEEIGTGEQSGTWGATTNTNLELIAEAFSYGTEAITTNADDHATVVADGSTDEGRSMYLKYTGSLDSTCTITISAGSAGTFTLSKVWLIENATSGGQDIIITSGSGASITIKNGQVKMVASDGAGSGGIMYDLLQDVAIPDLFIDDDLTLQSDGAVLGFGADTDVTLTHVADTGLLLNAAMKLQFRDSAISIRSSADATLDLAADGDINLTAGVDINIPSGVGLTFGDDGEKIEGDGTDLTISGNNINLTATADVNIPSGVGLTFATAEKIESDGTDLSITVGSGGDINIPANIGLTFGDDGEKIEGDGTDLTIAGNNINLTAVADVNIPSGVGLTFATAEKIESDGTDLSITVGSGGDINIPANIGVTFGDDGEKIEGDGTDLTITGNNINLTATADVIIPANVGITFGTGEKIEGDSTDLTITSGAKINLTATSDVVIPSGVGLILDGSGNEKIESDGTDISISVGSGGDINIPANIGVAFGNDGEKIEGDGTDLTITGNNINLTATADVIIPANVGITFGTGEKIEGDSTDLTITSGAKINLTATSDVVIPSGVGLILDGSGDEKIESDGTDISISVGSNGDINIPSNIGLTFGDDGEKIEGDGTDLTISGNNINLTATADVNIPSGVGLTFATGEKIESDGTDLTITVGSGGDINIPANIGLTFGDDGEKIEGDGSDLTISGNSITLSGNTTVTGNFTVNGTTTTVNTTNLTVTDPLVKYGQTYTGTAYDQGFIVTRGDGSSSNTANRAFIWDESADEFVTANTNTEDGTTAGNVTINDYANLHVGKITADDASVFNAITASGILKTDDTTEATSTTDGSLQTDGGLSVVKDAVFGDDVKLLSDSSVLVFGAGSDVTLTHTDDTGLTLNSTRKLMFNDASQFIQGSSATVLSLGATDEIDLTATAIDINGNADISGTLGVTGVVTANAGVVVDNITIDGTTIDLSSGNLTIQADAGEISIDAGTNGTIRLKDDTAEYGQFYKSGNNLAIYSAVQDASLFIQGNDADGGLFTALSFDMSDQGSATFNHDVKMGDLCYLLLGAGNDLELVSDGTNGEIACANGNLTLDVSGAVIIDTGGDLLTNTASGTTNTRIGSNAGDSIVASNAGVNNIMIGLNAGTAVDSGDTNICIGVEALEAEDDHANNIAIGYQALHVQDSGRDTYNIAIGYQAGLDNDSGFRNVLIGAAAGAQASTADSLMAIGYNAGGGVSANPLTGNENTCIGYAAGQAIEGTTANNTFVGSQAGTGSTTGYENVALGYKALSGNVQGRHNVAIGVQALDVANPDTATSQYNTAVGAYAGLAVGTGGENTLIGGFAGRNVTSSNYNTMLGYSAGYYNTTGEQNTFVGNSAAQGVNLTKLTGNNNTALGYKSGFLLQGAATLNTYVGASAGAAATTANDNTAVGAFAFDAGTGANNTAVGSGALGNASNSGTDNVAVGKDAAVGLTSGYDSVYIGHNAGLGATSGYSNTCVGEQSAGGATMSGNENTFLGRASGYSVSSGSNLLLLGNNAGRASAPGGNHTNGDNSIVVGNNSSENAYIKIDWTVTSDERDKTDFTALDLGLDFVKSMKPYTFRWDQRSDYGDSTADNYKVTDQTPDGTHKKDQLDVGFKAQDIEALEKAAGYKISDKTNLVASLTKDETQYGLKYSKFIPILVKAIQEQNTLIETLTARVATLEG